MLGLGATVGLAVMTAMSTGDALAAGVLLGLAAADVAAGAIGVLVGIAVIGRWGSSSLAALAGGQAVFGAAGWSGPPGMVLSSWAAAVAVLLACPRRPAPVPSSGAPAAGASFGHVAGASFGHIAGTPFGHVAGVLACGIFAAALVAGPAVGNDTASVVGLRVAASAVAAVVAMVLARACPRPVARVAGLIAAAAAAALAVLA